MAAEKTISIRTQTDSFKRYPTVAKRPRGVNSVAPGNEAMQHKLQEKPTTNKNCSKISMMLQISAFFSDQSKTDCLLDVDTKTS